MTDESSLDEVEPLPLAPSGTEVVIIFVALSVSSIIFAGLCWFENTQPFALAAIEVVPVALIAVLAYAGERHWLGRIVALAYWATAIAFVTMLSCGAVMLGGIQRAVPKVPAPLIEGGKPQIVTHNPWDAFFQKLGLQFIEGTKSRILWGMAIVLASAFLGTLMYLRPLRRLGARMIPIHPRSFVHAVALATVVAVTPMLFVPLALWRQTSFGYLFKWNSELADASHEELSGLLYRLVWMVVACTFAVGYGQRRWLGEACVRLGLVVPRWYELAAAFVFTPYMTIGMHFVNELIDNVWKYHGWPSTDEELMKPLFGFAMNRLGALVIGVSAGVGEELAVRGVLQPRLGIVLSNLLFTALHASQYHFDGLLSVFIIGLLFGFVRKASNTTTSAICHGLYDFLLVMYSVHVQAQGG